MKTPRKGPKRHPRPSSTVAVKLDPVLKKLYDGLITELRHARAQGAEAFDALWESAGKIVEHHPPLYVVGGYESDVDFFARELEEKWRNAYRFIRVAKFATPREEEIYGTTKLDAALSYVEAKVGAPLAHPPLPVSFDRLRIPVKKGAEIHRVPLTEARVEDINAATRALRKQDKAPTSSVERALHAALRKHSALADVHVRVRRGLVTFTGVPVGSLGVFTTLVGKAKWETLVDRGELRAKRAGGKNGKARSD